MAIIAWAPGQPVATTTPPPTTRSGGTTTPAPTASLDFTKSANSSLVGAIL